MKSNPLKRSTNLGSLAAALLAVGAISLPGQLFGEEKANPLQTALAATTISGYVDTAAVWRLGNNTSVGGAGSGWLVPGSVNGNPTLAGGAYQNKADIFNVNVVGLSIAKPLDEAEWSAGYQVDLLFGPDAVGWNPSVNSFGINDMAIKQAYVTLRAPVGNGLDFKLGTFDTVVGYEAFESCKNPTWTRSYGWDIEPTAHTGALVSYEFSDMIAVSGGIANTAATGISARSARTFLFPPAVVSETEKTYLASFSLTAPENLGFLAGSTLTAAVVDGLAGGASDTTWLYVGGTLNTPVESLKLGLAYDERLTSQKGVTPGVPGVTFQNSTYAYTLAGYITWQATEKLKVNGRFDYAKGTAGTWYGVGAGESDPQNRLLGLTAGLDYSLWENVITRIEFRWDKDLTSQHLNSAGNVPNGAPFGFDDRHNMFVALNVIYKF